MKLSVECLIKLTKNGLTPKQIADLCDISLQTVYDKYYVYNIDYNNTCKRAWPEVRQLHKTHTVLEMSEKMNKSCSWIHHTMQKMKLKPLLLGKRVAVGMAYLSYRGYTMTDIADEFGCTKSNVSYMKRKYGVNIRSRMIGL